MNRSNLDRCSKDYSRNNIYLATELPLETAFNRGCESLNNDTSSNQLSKSNLLSEFVKPARQGYRDGAFVKSQRPSRATEEKPILGHGAPSKRLFERTRTGTTPPRGLHVACRGREARTSPRSNAYVSRPSSLLPSTFLPVLLIPSPVPFRHNNRAVSQRVFNGRRLHATRLARSFGLHGFFPFFFFSSLAFHSSDLRGNSMM